MKAIVYEKYGSPDVLELKDVEKPVPRDNEVLIRIKASSVNFADWGCLRGEPFLVRLWSGFFKPKNKILGGDIAGIVESAGKDASLFSPGDEVFGDLSTSGWGGYAEYVCADEKVITIKPANISFEEAASVPVAGITALQGLSTSL